MTRISASILASAAAAVLLGTAAQAQTAQVRVGDLNLASPAGRAELDRRIANATRKVCLTAAPATSRAERDELSRCEAGVRAQVAAALPA